MSASPIALPPGKPCPNCGAPDVQHYCATCGQKNVDLHAPLPEMISEAIEDAIGLDSRVRHTVVPFLFRPGFLTRAFAEGKRARYTSPFKLYIATSAAYFVLSSVIAQPKIFKFSVGPDSVEIIPAGEPPKSPDAHALEQLRQHGRLGVRMAEQLERLNSSDPVAKAAAQSSFETDVGAALPKATFVLLPVFAFLIWLVNRKKDHFYIDALVFSLHVHAFLFTVALLAKPLPPRADALVVTGLTLAYVFRAQCVVYRDRLHWAALKLFVVAVFYSTIVALGLAAVALIELLLY